MNDGNAACSHVLLVKFDQRVKNADRILDLSPPVAEMKVAPMQQHQTDHWVKPPTSSRLRGCAPCMILWLLAVVMQWPLANAQQADPAAVVNPAPLTAEQIVHKLVQMNIRRAQALHAYQETRTYQVKYQGFLGTRCAKMVVTMKYLSPGKKKFVVQSETGSKLIIDRVLK